MLREICAIIGVGSREQQHIKKKIQTNTKWVYHHTKCSIYMNCSLSFYPTSTAKRTTLQHLESSKKARTNLDIA